MKSFLLYLLNSDVPFCSSSPGSTVCNFMINYALFGLVKECSYINVCEKKSLDNFTNGLLKTSYLLFLYLMKLKKKEDTISVRFESLCVRQQVFKKYQTCVQAWKTKIRQSAAIALKNDFSVTKYAKICCKQLNENAFLYLIQQ